MSHVAVWLVSTVCPPLSPAICSAVNGRTLVSQGCLSVRGTRDSHSVTVTAVITLDFCPKPLTMSPPEACCGTRAAKLPPTPLPASHRAVLCDNEQKNKVIWGQEHGPGGTVSECAVASLKPAVLSREDAPVDVSSSDASSSPLSLPSC